MSGRLAWAVPEVLRTERQFRLLFAGGVLSVIGDRVTLVALPFAVLAAGGDVTDVGLVAAAIGVPYLLLAIPAGVIGDRRDRQRILVVSDLVRGLCQVLAGTLLLAGAAEVWHLAAISLLYGSMQALGSPTYTAFVPQTIAEPRNLQPANALRSLAMSTGSIAGPIIAAGLIALGGPGVALVFDGVTFFAGAVCLTLVRPSALPPLTTQESFRAGLAGGWREVRSRPWVSSFLAAMVVYHVVVLPSVFVLGPVLADDELGGATAWAAITVAFGVGAVIGDVLVLRWRPDHALRVAAFALLFASSQAAVFGSGLPLAAIMALELVAAIGVSTYFTLWEVTLQEHIPPRALGRVSSYDYLTTAGLMPLGVALAGPIAEAIGIHETLLLMSVVGWLTALALLAVPSVRDLGRPLSAGAP